MDIPLHTVPERYRSELQTTVGEFATVADPVNQRIARLHPAVADSLPKVWLCSPFAARYCRRDAEWFLQDATAAHFLHACQKDDYRTRAGVEVDLATSEADLLSRLRRFRCREMVRLAWRDIAGWASIEDTLRETSYLAEALVGESLRHLFEAACEKWGVPAGEDGTPQAMLVLAMGKLGAWELNFSSDIDLIFCYRQEGTLSHRRGISFNEFYTRLAQRLIHVLDRATEDGFVFRVDMRLRPFGDSGPLVLSFEAMERYYQGQAREWERYAMVKARPIAGDPVFIREVEQLLRPFVYRRYLDYRAFAELRGLKEKIALELKRTDRVNNIKLGAGGIREIEFIGQAFQLIRGGRDTTLQERRLLPVLELLGQRGHLPVPVVTKLAESYRFLRRLENRLQQYGDQQTHELPENERQRAVLAFGMGWPDWDSLKRQIDAVRRQVHEVFELVMAAPQTAVSEIDFLGGEEGPPLEAIAALGFRDPARIRALLEEFKSTSAIRRLTARGATELNRLLPLILRALAGVDAQEASLERILGLLEAVASRNVYFTLLNENPLALSQLVKLATASAWIVHYIARFPILLDELLDPQALYSPLTREELKEQLAQRLLLIDRLDQEQLMVSLRQFKQAQVLRVAATDIMEITPVMEVSDQLSFIAEAVVEATLEESWRWTALRHGLPQDIPAGKIRGFAVIAYGKLGGLELGYGSDLDLVFLHKDTPPERMTLGSSPLPVVEFYARVARRIISLMTTQTHAGTLYDIDLRLRPSGSSGLLVSSLEAYETYQLSAAWTWEQQSLVRARFVAGDESVRWRFEAIREKSLTRVRDRQRLREEVRTMREKMRNQLAVKDPKVFDLKQGQGGIADIEFLVQFEVLANAAVEPALIQWTDIVRQIESLSTAGFLSVDDAASLRLAYCRYRERAHRCALQELPALLPDVEALELRECVKEIWQRIMER